MDAYEESETILSTREGGDWHEKTTWIGRKVPDQNDRVFLNGIVEVRKNAECSVLVIENNAEFVVEPDAQFVVKTFENYGSFSEIGNMRILDQ